jgi:hypothetical protein
MQLLQELRSALNQKSVMRNVLFCLAIILLMHLLYGVYRSSSVLQEGKKGKGKNKKCKGKKRHSKKCAKSKCKGKNRKRYAVVSKKKKGKKRWKCTKCKGGKIVKKVGKNKIKCVKKPPDDKPPDPNPCKGVECDTLAVWTTGVSAGVIHGSGMVFLPGKDGELGTVMVAGGYDGSNGSAAAIPATLLVKLYDVAKGAWTDGTPMEARSDHGMVFLPGKGDAGAVMVAGGEYERKELVSVQLYDVATKKWEGGTDMKTARSDHGMVFLPGKGGALGTVMVAGGNDVLGSTKSVLLYDVATGVWTDGTDMKTARYGHGMVFLPGVGEKGTVMVAGGAARGHLASVELYNVATGVWTDGTNLPTARYDHGAVFLPGVGVNGTVMVAGGWSGSKRLASVELYDVATGGWTDGTDMKTARSGHGMVFLPGVGVNGTVMVAGGEYEGKELVSVQLYDVANGMKAIQCGCVGNSD